MGAREVNEMPSIIPVGEVLELLAAVRARGHGVRTALQVEPRACTRDRGSTVIALEIQEDR